VLGRFLSDFGYDINSDEIRNLDWVDAFTYEPPAGSRRKNPHTKAAFQRITVYTPSGNPSRIHFSFATEADKPEISIYTMNGRLVRQLTFSGSENRAVSIQWDGNDRNGIKLPAGSYVIRLHSGNRILSRKILLSE
jgi:hypothetical protein